jgi:hypothetical protein
MVLSLRLQLGQAYELNQRSLGRACIGATAAFKTFKWAEMSGVSRASGLYIQADLIRLEPHGACLNAPSAAYTRAMGLVINLIPGKKKDPGYGFSHRDIQA